MASNWWSSSRTFGPGSRNTASLSESAGGGLGRDEKAALKQAEEAERAFRASKGYELDTFWNRLKRRFRKIANEQGAELHRSAPCLCVTPVRRPLCGR